MRFTMLLLLFGLLFTACEGPEGAVGPQGPQGPQGPPGSVDVQAVTFTLTPSGFTGGAGAEQFNRNIPELTASVANNGIVMAYTDLGTGSVWFALPFSRAPGSSLETLTYAFAPGQFAFIALSVPATTLANSYDGHRIRVVLIPSSEAASKTDLDYSNYLNLARYYGLPLD